MLLLALMLSAAQPDHFQKLASPAFEALAKRTDALCPAKGIRYTTPGDLDWQQESFEEILSPGNLARLNAANVEEQRCANRDGLSCPVTATLEAMEKTHELRRFARFACSHEAPQHVIISGHPEFRQR